MTRGTNFAAGTQPKPFVVGLGVLLLIAGVAAQSEPASATGQVIVSDIARVTNTLAAGKGLFVQFQIPARRECGLVYGPLTLEAAISDTNRLELAKKTLVGNATLLDEGSFAAATNGCKRVLIRWGMMTAHHPLTGAWVNYDFRNGFDVKGYADAVYVPTGTVSGPVIGNWIAASAMAQTPLDTATFDAHGKCSIVEHGWDHANRPRSCDWGGPYYCTGTRLLTFPNPDIASIFELTVDQDTLTVRKFPTLGGGTYTKTFTRLTTPSP
jgi:hypothetical protein